MDFDLGRLVVVFLTLLLSLSVHESAHAWTAARLGDPTAARLGRITVNPLAHLDPLGTVLLPLVAFLTGAPIIGWAKPVPVDRTALRSPRRDFMAVAAAGPASNILLAVVASVVLRVAPVSPIPIAGVEVPVWAIAAIAFELNVLLAVFNMVPVPPLDGGNVLAGVLPEPAGAVFDRLIRPWGFVILYALLLTGVLQALIVPPYLFISRLLTG